MFYYTNFIAETNAWWLRRVRPIWMGATFIYIYWLFHRYYFFGKQAVKSQRTWSKEEREYHAQLNKRNFGYGVYYQPTYYRSRKKMIMQAMGDSYDYAVESQQRFRAMRSFQELDQKIKAENDY